MLSAIQPETANGRSELNIVHVESNGGRSELNVGRSELNVGRRAGRFHKGAGKSPWSSRSTEESVLSGSDQRNYLSKQVFS